MNTLTLNHAQTPSRDTRLVFELLKKLHSGLLEVRLPDGSCRLFGEGTPGVRLLVHDEKMFAQILARGDIGLARELVARLEAAGDFGGDVELVRNELDAPAHKSPHRRAPPLVLMLQGRQPQAGECLLLAQQLADLEDAGAGRATGCLPRCR